MGQSQGLFIKRRAVSFRCASFAIVRFSNEIAAPRFGNRRTREGRNRARLLAYEDADGVPRTAHRANHPLAGLGPSNPEKIVTSKGSLPPDRMKLDTLPSFCFYCL
jgi:hypothetical protein